MTLGLLTNLFGHVSEAIFFVLSSECTSVATLGIAGTSPEWIVIALAMLDN